MSATISPLKLLDQGAALLGARGFRPALWFYAGALPWCAGLLAVWTRLASWHTAAAAYAGAALLLSLLYAWHGFCSSRAMEALDPAPPLPWAARCLRDLQNTGMRAVWLVAGCFSFLIWTSTFYVAGLYFPLELRAAPGRKAPARAALVESVRLSGSWYKRQQLFALHCLLMAVCVAVNLAAAAFAVPYLLKSLLGVSSLWTRISPRFLLLNSTFWIGLLLLTYLLMAPLVLAAAAVSYDELKNRRTGGDLRRELALLQQERARVVVVE